MGYKHDEPYQPPEIDANGVAWSQYEDWQAGANATVRAAIEASPHGKAFLAELGTFTAKASRHELVSVQWWHYPYVYVEVTDGRLDYPTRTRAVISFDLANGLWASWSSKRRYVLARRGWQAFLSRISGSAVTVGSEESADERELRGLIAANFAEYGHHHYEPCAICAAA